MLTKCCTSWFHLKSSFSRFWFCFVSFSLAFCNASYLRKYLRKYENNNDENNQINNINSINIKMHSVVLASVNDLKKKSNQLKSQKKRFWFDFFAKNKKWKYFDLICKNVWNHSKIKSNLRLRNFTVDTVCQLNVKVWHRRMKQTKKQIEIAADLVSSWVNINHNYPWSHRKLA